MPYPTVTKTMVGRAPLPLPAEARYAVLEGDARLRRDGETWDFQIEGLRTLSGTRTAADEARVWGRWTGKPVTRFGLELNVDGLDLDATWPLVLAVAPPSFDRWAGLAPRGRVETLRATAQRARAGMLPTFTVHANLVNVGVQPIGRWPGLSGLSLQLDGNDEQGQAEAARRATRVRVAADVHRTDRARARDGRRWLAARGRRLDCERQGRAGRARPGPGQGGHRVRLREARRLADPDAGCRSARGRRHAGAEVRAGRSPARTHDRVA